MRTVLVSVTMALLAVGCGGGSSEPDADPLGADCSMGQSCGPHTCVENVCTTACAATDDCRAGTECRDTGGGTFMCVNKRWEGGDGQFHTNCGVNGDADCASGYECLDIRESDPSAYCTKTCTEDRDCPPEYTCGADPMGGVVKCLRNVICSACQLDEECVTPLVQDGKCVDDGSG